jgi:hypothetical protein
MKNDTLEDFSNRETWLVNFRLFASKDLEDFWADSEDPSTTEVIGSYALADRLREFAETHVKEGLAIDLSLTQLEAVQWREIAQSMIDFYHEYYEYTRG